MKPSWGSATVPAIRREGSMTWSRWKLCLYLAFLQGADIIYPESGHYTYQVDKWGETRWNMFDRDHPNLLRSRRILREFYRFCMIHQRPTSDPETRIGILFGNNEGFPNLWNPYAWGQYENGKEWEAGPPEQGWKLPQALLRKENVFHETVMGECNRSGNPAGGQYDVVPLETMKPSWGSATVPAIRREGSMTWSRWKRRRIFPATRRSHSSAGTT